MVRACIAAKKPKTADDLIAQAVRDNFPKLGSRYWRDARRSEVRAEQFPALEKAIDAAAPGRAGASFLRCVGGSASTA
jgi:hypothetical protein